MFSLGSGASSWLGFALFIVACGSTHLLEVVTTWSPVFWVDAWANIITAVLSASVAFSLIRRSPTISFGINDYAARLADSETEKQGMENSLLAARKLEDWSRMSASVAHEIASPLESIHNLLFLIRNAEGTSPEVSDLANTAADEAARVMTITRSTLGFFRQSTKTESIDLLAAADSVRFLLNSAGQQKHIQIDIRATGNVCVQAYPGEARQVLLNLVRNAVEATSKLNTTVTLSLEGRPDGVEIAVSDQGSGIPPTVLATLFQFGNSTKGNDGNGMGLWTVKHILDKHNGYVRVKSVVGQGTRFDLFWPREQPPETRTLPSTRASQTKAERLM